MSDPKTQKPSTPDTLTKSGKDAAIELSETELQQVSGGQKNKAPRHIEGETSDYLVVTLTDASVTNYSD
jgi:bacteriocin-like protein